MERVPTLSALFGAKTTRPLVAIAAPLNLKLALIMVEMSMHANASLDAS